MCQNVKLFFCQETGAKHLISSSQDRCEALILAPCLQKWHGGCISDLWTIHNNHFSQEKYKSKAQGESEQQEPWISASKSPSMTYGKVAGWMKFCDTRVLRFWVVLGFKWHNILKLAFSFPVVSVLQSRHLHCSWTNANVHDYVLIQG